MMSIVVSISNKSKKLAMMRLAYWERGIQRGKEDGIKILLNAGGPSKGKTAERSSEKIELQRIGFETCPLPEGATHTQEMRCETLLTASGERRAANAISTLPASDLISPAPADCGFRNAD